MVTQRTWVEFYQYRINSSYHLHFITKYAHFLDMIYQECMRQNNPHIFEIGCGIGSISKALKPYNIEYSGFDLSHEMVALANENLGSDKFFQGDLFTMAIPVDTVNVTHGLLEHFSDETIEALRPKLVHSINYVPLDKYETPSFGDERLLPLEHWLELLKPSEYFTFNNGYDLCFKI